MSSGIPPPHTPHYVWDLGSLPNDSSYLIVLFSRTGLVYNRVRLCIFTFSSDESWVRPKIQDVRFCADRESKIGSPRVNCTNVPTVANGSAPDWVRVELPPCKFSLTARRFIV